MNQHTVCDILHAILRYDPGKKQSVSAFLNKARRVAGMYNPQMKLTHDTPYNQYRRKVILAKILKESTIIERAVKQGKGPVLAKYHKLSIPKSNDKALRDFRKSVTL